MIDNSVNFVHTPPNVGNRRVDVKLEPIVRRPARDLRVEVVRPLTNEDIVQANQPGRAPLPTSGTVQRLRESHHALARILAMGESQTAAAAITGFATSTISRLLVDPTFAGLVEFYRKNMDLAAVDLQARLSSLNADFVQELQDRIQDAPEKMSDGFVLKAIETLSDRTGHGPINRAVNINVAVGMAERLQAARQRALSPRQPDSPSDSEAA